MSQWLDENGNCVCFVFVLQLMESMFLFDDKPIVYVLLSIICLTKCYWAQIVGSGEEDNSDPKLVWTVEVDHHFLRLLQGYYCEHDSVSKIDTHSWKRFEDKMSRFFHTKTLYRKFQAKRDRMRQVYRA